MQLEFAQEEGDCSSCETCQPLVQEAVLKPADCSGSWRRALAAGAALALAAVGVAGAVALRSGTFTEPSETQGMGDWIGLAVEGSPYQTYAYAAWSDPIKAGNCGHIRIQPKTGTTPKLETATIRCTEADGFKTYSFPAGIFEIDEQMLVPRKVRIIGASNPNAMSDPTQSPDWTQQTLFLATRGATDFHMKYCFESDMVHTRVGFVLDSYVTMRDLSYQGVDTIRPDDNNALCGGAAFETKGCARNDCSTDVNNGGSDGRGSVHVTIENVRLNDYYFDQDKKKVGAPIDGNTQCEDYQCCFCKPNGVRSTQVGIWIPESRNHRGTRHFFANNVVSRSNQADGINLHGKVMNATVQNTHFSNTGDDTYALWGANSAPTGVTFKNGVAVSPGIMRPNWYGVCVATYGLKEVVFDGITCRSPTSATAIIPPWGGGQSFYSTSMFVFYTSFSAGYPAGNSLTIKNFTFTDLEGTPYEESNGHKDKPKRGEMVWTNSSSGKKAPYYLVDQDKVNVIVQ